MLVSLLTALNTVKTTVVNSAQNVIKALGRMKRR
jgi:hypothetical protein